MGPTARFSAVLGPWCARAEVRAALVRDQVFLKSSNHRERDERERKRERQPKARTRIRVDFLARGSSCRLFLSRSLFLFLFLGFSPVITISSSSSLAIHLFSALQSQNVAGLEREWNIGTTWILISRLPIF